MHTAFKQECIKDETSFLTELELIKSNTYVVPNFCFCRGWFFLSYGVDSLEVLWYSYILLLMFHLSLYSLHGTLPKL